MAKLKAVQDDLKRLERAAYRGDSGAGKRLLNLRRKLGLPLVKMLEIIIWETGENASYHRTWDNFYKGVGVPFYVTDIHYVDRKELVESIALFPPKYVTTPRPSKDIKAIVGFLHKHQETNPWYMIPDYLIEQGFNRHISSPTCRSH